ncbi:MAG: hypothetical protein AMXMBFR57_20180 [Acidimicrobiia bacterium]
MIETRDIDPGQVDYSPCYVSDLGVRSVGDKVAITGHYIAKRDYTDRVVITVQDITGSTFVKLSLDQMKAMQGLEKYSRVRVLGLVGLSKRGTENVIPTVDRIENLGSLKVAFQDLSSEMKDYASRMFVSRISHACTAILREQRFDEFESKVISSEWVDGGLEPLQVIYPGFGNPAVLVTSPNAQVMEFLNATGVGKAFTVALSFTSTYRHPDNSAETKVILAKASDIPPEELRSLSISVCKRIVEKLSMPHSDPIAEQHLDAVWPDALSGLPGNSTLALFQYDRGIMTGGTGWRNMLLESVIQVVGKTGLVLIDGAIERIGQRTVSTLAIYPARFLSLIDSPLPRRRLRNLGQYKSWH